MSFVDSIVKSVRSVFIKRYFNMVHWVQDTIRRLVFAFKYVFGINGYAKFFDLDTDYATKLLFYRTRILDLFNKGYSFTVAFDPTLLLYRVVAFKKLRNKIDCVNVDIPLSLVRCVSLMDAGTHPMLQLKPKQRELLKAIKDGIKIDYINDVDKIFGG